MEYRILGKTGLRISRIGFGGIPIQRITKQEAPALLDAVEKAGINYIDTARGYTVSEEWLGYALDGRRDRFILATKSMARTYEAMKADIEKSLSNLRTDHIDLYQIHNPNPAQLAEVLAPGGAMEALTEAKAAGKIRHIGLTAHLSEVFESALSVPEVETVMFPYNLVEGQGTALIARAAKQNIGFICMKPLAGGAIENGKLALSYILSNNDVTCVIPGMATAKEVAENSSAVGSVLTGEDLAEIEKIRVALGTRFCRRCGYCAPCTVGINIPGAFLFQGYLTRYGLENWARDRYNAMPVTAGACIGCGKCETRCPYQLPIRDMLSECKEAFGK